MNDKTAGGDPGAKQKAPKATLQKIFMRDLSFELPNGYGTFSEARAPKMDVDIRISYAPWPEDKYEVILHVRMHVFNPDAVTLCLIELQQGGLFEIPGCSDDEVGKLIGSDCAAALYPFAREVIWSTLGKGGFPTALLAPLDLTSMLLTVKEMDAEREERERAEGKTQQASA